MRRPYLEVFLVSLAVILLQVSYTRVFSFKLFYYFTYLIIGISLLGLGAGGVLVAVVTRLRRMAPARLIPTCSLVAGMSVLVGYLVVARTQLNAFDLVAQPSEMGELLLICGCLFLPFLAAGLVLTTIFSTHRESISRLYFVDLLGAGLGCALCIPCMVVLSPPGCIMLAGFVFVLAGLPLALSKAHGFVVPVAAIALPLLLGVIAPAWLPEPVPDRVKTMSPQRHDPATVLFSGWSPIFRVDVVRAAFMPDALLLAHDGMWGSVIRRFDGNAQAAVQYDTDERAHPFRLLRPSPRVAIVGSAGGNEIVASLHFGAAHVTAIELNPVTISLLTDQFAGYSGHLANNPQVTLVNAEARSFLRATFERYDLVWLVAPDSYAAMNAATAGAFVLSESYLYTVEMIVESLGRLTDGGILCVQFGEADFEHKPNRTARFLATAREAYRRLGIQDFGRHVLVGTSGGFMVSQVSTILLKRTPFGASDVERFAASTALIKGARVQYPRTQRDGDRPGSAPIASVIALGDEDLARWYSAYRYDVRPVTDDSPFFWHFVPFRSLLSRIGAAGFWTVEEGTGEQLLVVLLAVATVFAATFLLAPLFLVRGVWGAIPYRGRAAVYFAALGLGFMFFEVSLIQRLTLFLGSPTHSLTVTLFALLVSTGLGSLLTERYASQRNGALLGLGACLVVLVLFYQVGMEPMLNGAIGWPFLLRAAVAIALLLPLGLCLGAFMPIGLGTVSSVTPYAEEFVAWSWAVNGFFSVVSAVLATILSMTIGFSAVMAMALAVYWVGIGAFVSMPVASPVREERQGPCELSAT